MKEDTKIWLRFAKENLEAAKILFNSHLYNPALQNIQQSIEKALKSLFLEFGIKLKKSHSIAELRNLLIENNIEIGLSEDECDLLDSIYLPSKYPVGSALPDFYPDEEITNKCLTISEKVILEVEDILSE